VLKSSWRQPIGVESEKEKLDNSLTSCFIYAILSLLEIGDDMIGAKLQPPFTKL